MVASFSRRRLATVVLAVCTGAALLNHATVASAAILADFSGNHQAVAENNNTRDAALSFAVFERGGSPGDVFGTGFAGFDASFQAASVSPSQLDTSADYLYLYQYVNDGTGTGGFDRLFIPAAPITSLGHWNWGLRDAHGPVDRGNPFGNNTGGFQPAAEAMLGVSQPSIANTAGLIDKIPTLSYPDRLVRADFPLGLQHQEASSIFGFTSNAPPVVQNFLPEDCDAQFACGGFVTPLNADFDGDGDVDGGDLVSWENGFDTSAAGDADKDRDTDGADFLAWQRFYTNFGGVAAGAAVPEPSAGLGLLILSILPVLHRSRACRTHVR